MAIPNGVGKGRKKKIIDRDQVRDFTWLFFIHAKSNFPGIADDLVNSYHLLLCVVNFVYLNVLCISSPGRLINPDFPGLPFAMEDNIDLIVENEKYQILEALCQRHQGVLLDAQCIDLHWFRPHVKELIKVILIILFVQICSLFAKKHFMKVFIFYLFIFRVSDFLNKKF